MKLVRYSFLMITLLLCSIVAKAHDFEVGGICYNIATEESYTVHVARKNDYTNYYNGDVVIPSTVVYLGNTYRVTGVDNSAFYYSLGLKSVTLPECVTIIEGSAFSYCTNLTSIKGLTNVKKIESFAFSTCHSLTSLVLGDSLESVGNNAFEDCVALTAINLANTVSVIGNSAFSDCTKLTSIVIPEGITNVGAYTFDGCCSLASVKLPNSLTQIGNYAFRGCEKLGTVTIPNNVTSIGTYAFANCTYLSSVTLSNNVSVIEPYTFQNCECLGSINISDRVKSIGSSAFYNNFDLDEVIIGSGMESIGAAVFFNCSGIGSITCKAINPPKIEASTTFNKVNRSIPVYVPTNSVEAYKVASYWKEFTNILPIENYMPSGICGDHLTWRLTEEGELIIEGYGDMYDYSWESTNKAPWSEYEIKKVTIETGATSIGDYAFMMLGTNDISLPESLVRIGEGAFYACEYIERFTIPNGVESVGLEAFEGCFNMTDIHIPASLKQIGDNAFTECEELRRVHITNVEAWCEIEYGTAGSHPFYASASRYESILFMDNDVVRDLFIPKTVTYINRFAFYNIEHFTSITCEAVVPPTIEGPYAFDKTDKSIPVYVPAASLDDYKTAQYWKDFFNILPIKRETSIVDGEDFQHNQEEEFTGITYTRTFNNTNWQALYVPFEIPVTAEFLADFEVAYINNVHQRDYDDDGVTEQTEVEAFKITKGTLRANYPYLIRAKEAGKKIITVTNTTLYATEENSIDCASVFRTYTFTGTYKRLSSDVLPQSEGYYALSGGKWKPIAAGSSLGAFRFYLQVKSRGGDAATKALSIRMRIFDEYGNEEITEVEEVEANLPAEDVVYDLQGRRVEVPGKGVYIVNGKKMVF